MRFDVLGQVQIHSVWRLRPMLLRELSLEGFSLESTTPFELDTIFKFRLGVDGERRSIVVQARAVHCTLISVTADIPLYVAGFQLVGATDAVRAEMQHLVEYAEWLWRQE